MVPYLTSQAPWFTFLVHLRDAADFDRTVGVGALLRRYSSGESDYIRKISTMQPVVIGNVRFDGSAATGEVIGLARFPEQMVSSEARRWVHEAALLAVSRGTRVLGLGALTSPATGSGLSLPDAVPRGVTVTNGNSLTAAIVRDNVVEAATTMGLGTAARVAVVGCTGSVGGAASRLLAAEGFPLTLIGRSAERVSHAFGDLAAARRSGSIVDAADCDIVVTLTSDAAARLEPPMLQPGAIVIDCAQPPNVDPAARDRFRAHGIAVVEGALVRIPGFSCTANLNVSLPRATFACLAETVLFARCGIREHSVGRASVVMALRMARLAAAAGIAAVPLAEHLVPREVCA